MLLARSILLMTFAALAACGQPAEPNGGGVRSDDVAGDVRSLAGEWRVAAIDGHSLDLPVGLALSGDDARLWWEPQCAGIIRHYQIKGRSVSFSRSDSPASSEGSPNLVCSIGLHPRLADVTRALDGATTASRTASNGVLISGPDHSVTLFAQ